MTQPLPTTSEAMEYFLRFRRQREATIAANARRAPSLPRSSEPVQPLVTQVDQSGAAPRQDEGINRIVPMDLSNGTQEERLQKLRVSPKNTSPNLANPKIWSLLPMQSITSSSRITLVLDIDETLVHSSFQPKDGVRYDLELPITHEGKPYLVFVKYRPFLMEFLNFVAAKFEIVVFTASLAPYCNALMDQLDPQGRLGAHRLFREHCTRHPTERSGETTYVKDLCLLGRDLGKIAIVDNSPNAYLYQQRNAIPIASFFSDEKDTALRDLLPLLENLSRCEMVYDVLDKFNATGRVG